MCLRSCRWWMENPGRNSGCTWLCRDSMSGELIGPTQVSRLICPSLACGWPEGLVPQKFYLFQIFIDVYYGASWMHLNIKLRILDFCLINSSQMLKFLHQRTSQWDCDMPYLCLPQKWPPIPSSQDSSLSHLFNQSMCVCPPSLSRVWLFCDPRDCSPAGSSGKNFPGKNTGAGCHFLLQESSWPRDRTCVSCTGRRVLYH